MNDLSDQACDQARFAARELVERWVRETGEEISSVVRDRMLFMAEMGYLRGHGDGVRAGGALFEELKKKEEDR